MRPLSQIRHFGILAVCAMAISLAGCHTIYEFKGALIALPDAQKLLGQAKNIDIILVSETDGTVFPKRLLIASHTDAVIWVSEGKHLDVTFDNTNIKPKCSDQIAVCVLLPLDLPTNEYGYGGQVTDQLGFPHRLDPKIEIVR